MRTNVSVMVLGLVCAMCLAAQSSAAVMTHKHKAVSQLFGSPSMNARSVYQQCLMDGTTCKKFSVIVDHAPANRTFNVYVNARSVGVVHTNSRGTGRMSMRTAAFIGASGAHVIPSGFPRVDTGDHITLGHMAGLFYCTSDDESADYEVDGEFEDCGCDDVGGDVSYSEEFDEGVLQRTFELSFEGAAPHEVLDITVNGIVVFTVTADEDGEVDLTLQSASPDDSGGNCDDNGDDNGDDGEQTIPDSFPSIMAGDVIGIGSATATMSGDDG